MEQSKSQTEASALSRTVSFNTRSTEQTGLSIVFSASWVRLIAPIGEGAFSRVYEGIYRNPETLDEAVVAVKILKKNMLKRRSDCLRFIKEAKIMTKIHNPNIAACYGIGKYDDDDPHNPGSLFIVQELVRGGNLLHKVYKQMLNRAKCIYTSQEALSWMIDVAQGMLYLHSIVDGKPMIIHRDLKLENIMLSPEATGAVTAKLVDFGLHKVIDDRIKKVVKRVISEANLGTRFMGRKGGQELQGRDDEGEEEDELDAVLAEQRAMVAASSVKPGVGPAATSFLGASPAAQRIRGSPLRVTSRLTIESSSPSMHAMPEADEEDETSGTAQDTGTEIVGEKDETQPSASSASSLQEPNQHCSGATQKTADAKPSGESPALVKVRAPPKKQSSMAKLMAKMKEIKLKVIGSSGAVTKEANASGLSRTTLAEHRNGEMETPAAKGTTSTLEGGSGSRLQTSSKATEAEQSSKVARNEQLFNRIVAQQQQAPDHDHLKGTQTIAELGLDTGAPVRQARMPPRRAVTWINEIRYNLTEAVGSWAYMAPEVVLGQPYNEKVDVFSFGVILFEVLNRKLMLVDEIKNDPRKDAQAYAERVARGFRPEIPRRWPEELSQLISACWAQDPHVRPNFTAIVDELKELEEEGSVRGLDVQYWSKGSVFV